MKLFNIGFGNFIALDRLVSVLSVESAPIKRLIHIAKEKGVLIDASCGRKTQSVLIMDTGHVVLSAMKCDLIAGKMDKEEKE